MPSRKQKLITIFINNLVIIPLGSKRAGERENATPYHGRRDMAWPDKSWCFFGRNCRGSAADHGDCLCFGQLRVDTVRLTVRKSTSLVSRGRSLEYSGGRARRRALAVAWEEEPALAFILAYNPVVTAQRQATAAYQPPTLTRRVLEHTAFYVRAASGTSTTVSEGGDTTTSTPMTVGIQVNIPLASPQGNRAM